MSRILKSIHPDDDAHYEKMGLDRDKIELWEDGRRNASPNRRLSGN